MALFDKASQLDSSTSLTEQVKHISAWVSMKESQNARVLLTE